MEKSIYLLKKIIWKYHCFKFHHKIANYIKKSHFHLIINICFDLFSLWCAVGDRGGSFVGDSACFKCTKFVFLPLRTSFTSWRISSCTVGCDTHWKNNSSNFFFADTQSPRLAILIILLLLVLFVSTVKRGGDDDSESLTTTMATMTMGQQRSPEDEYHIAKIQAAARGKKARKELTE